MRGPFSLGCALFAARLDQKGALADSDRMTIELKPSAASSTAPIASRVILAEHIPEITDADLQALLARSKTARHLKGELDGRLEAGGCCSRDEVIDLVKRAHEGRGERAKGDHAIVIAYYAQHHAEVFAPDAHAVVAKFLAQQDWPSLMADLHRFMEELRQQEAEQKRAAQVQQERQTDDLKRDDAKRALVKGNGSKADRQRETQKTEAHKAEQKAQLKAATSADLDDELTGAGRLPLSDVERTKLALMKKGFANKG